MTFLAFDLLQSGVPLAMVCAVIGLVFAVLLIGKIIRSSPGNERMRQIAGAIEEGATLVRVGTAIFGTRSGKAWKPAAEGASLDD